MPKLGQDLENFKATNSHFSFSGVGLNKLNATEYTLVSIAVDKSGSVQPFESEINKVIASIVESCRKSPRADNLLLRVIEFNTSVSELHGFKELANCNQSDYNDSNMKKAGGGTALIDSTLTSVEAVVDYGKQLKSQDYMANAVVFIITDGDDNESRLTMKHIKDKLVGMKTDESVESVTSVLIGVNVTDQKISGYLKKFKDEAGLDSYLEIDSVSPQKLAKLAQFVSKSVSSVSQSLGQGKVSLTI